MNDKGRYHASFPVPTNNTAAETQCTVSNLARVKGAERNLDERPDLLPANEALQHGRSVNQSRPSGLIGPRRVSRWLLQKPDLLASIEIRIQVHSFLGLGIQA
jgi:hypothetical protein